MEKGRNDKLYKGKREKGKCSNESNMEKLWKTIIKLIEYNIRCGSSGTNGRATEDYIMTLLKHIIQINTNLGKLTYMSLLDITKAYDKVWLDMYVMHKLAITASLWTIMKRLNEILTTKIATRCRLTIEIKITDSIKQGGCLSMLQYALLINKISKEISKTM